MEQIGIQIKATDDASVAFGRVGDEAQRMQQSIAGAGTASAIAMDKLGISAKQTSFALRQVPAQFTDIVVSLQGGQNPLTVLLQQGGQLKDVFGGIVPAARALGGYVAGLVNPFTLAAGAAAVLGVAYYQGSKEADAYSKAMILTGNAAGTTVDQLQAMAASVSKATGATTGAAAEALAAVAGSGDITVAQMSRVAATAVRLERETGVAVADTVKQFAALAKDPVDASTKLNETTRFLTLRIYEQIKALEDQGRTAEAGALAIASASTVLNERMDKLQGNLGYIERAWRAVGEKAKKAWDNMLDIGRVDSSEQKLAALQKQLGDLQRLRASRPLVNTIGAAQTNAEELALQAQIATITGVVAAKNQSAEADAKAARAAKERIDFDKRGDSYATTAQKQEKTLQKEIEASRAAMEAGSITAKQYADRILAVQASFAKKESSGGRSGLSDAVRDQNERIRIGRQMAIDSGQEVIKSNEEFQKALVKNAEETAKWMDSYEASVRKTIAASDEEVASAQASYDAHNKLKSTLAEEALARLEIARTITQSAYEDTTVVDAQIANKKRLIAVLKSTELRDANEKSAADAAAEWKKASDSINTSLTDALLRGFESGKDAASNFRDTLVNMFKTLVLRPTISSIVQPVANTLTSALGIGGQGGVGGQGGIGGLSSIANLGSSLGTSISTTIADILPSSISAGLGLSSSSLIASNALIAGGGASGAAAATAAAAAGNAGALGGLGGLAAVPGLGLAIGGIALLGSLFGGGGFKSSGTTGNAGAVFDPAGQRTSSYVVDATTAATESVINRLQGNYASTAASLGIGTVATQFNYGGNTGAQGESPNFALGGGALRSGSFYQGETKLSDEALSLASSRAIFAALQGSDLPKYLMGVFDNLDAGQLSQDQITGALNTAAAFKALHDQLQDLPFAQLKDLSYTAAAGLAAVSGGLDKFQTNLASYYDKFYTDAEKTANTTASVTKALAGLGLAMPTLDENARTAYRKLVDAQDVTTVSGQKAYATLLSVSSAFDQIATAADVAAKAAADLKAAWQTTTDSIFDEVKRIRGLSGTGTATLASAQAQFAITTAQASAGDQTAAKLLPSLSQAMLTLAEASATSLLELRRIQGQTAASLSTTGNTLASRYGLTVPSFDVGTNLVPQDMLALIHKGEAIVPSAYNPAFNASAGNGDLIAEVRALRDQVARLEAINQDTATNTRKTAQTLVRVTRDGESMLTEVAT